MKFTITHHNKRNQLVLSTKTDGQFFNRIAKDDARMTVSAFRNYASRIASEDYCGYKDMATWMHVCPAAEFSKDAGGNLKMKASNGLLLLTYGKFKNSDEIASLKRSAAQLPMTFAVITGADGMTAHVLVRYDSSDGSMPVTEEDAGTLYESAFCRIAPLYKPLAGVPLVNTGGKITDDFLMTLDASPYYNIAAVPMRIDCHVSCNPVNIEEPTVADGGENNIHSMINFLRSRYEFRYNAVMKYVEYNDKRRGWECFMPVDPRVHKRMTLEVQLSGIDATIKDVRNFLESDYIKSYNPLEDFLFSCFGKWDGKDYIRALARTVPTDNPYWEDWFYTWFLGMVKQWDGGAQMYGNSVAPLLISKQGFNKSTFCRRLLPPVLQWGYNDNLLLSEKKQVLQAMSQFLLINLDEFNQISPQVQQGFLKNLIQLPNVKIKRPYGSHVEEFPRLASFIATSNMTDILSDPSGNRRFIGVELTGPIDVDRRINYQQLYAQALHAIDNKEKAYFNAEQTMALMESNRKFHVVSPVELCFYECFTVPKGRCEGEWFTAAVIFETLRKRFGKLLPVSYLTVFGRFLKNVPNIKARRMSKGFEYKLVEL